jgi:hypothetical protein
MVWPHILVILPENVAEKRFLAMGPDPKESTMVDFIGFHWPRIQVLRHLHTYIYVYLKMGKLMTLNSFSINNVCPHLAYFLPA